MAELGSLTRTGSALTSASKTSAPSLCGSEGDGGKKRWTRPHSVDPTPSTGTTSASAKGTRGNGLKRADGEGFGWNRDPGRQGPKRVTGWSCDGIGPTDTTVEKASTMESAQAKKVRRAGELAPWEGTMRTSVALLRSTYMVAAAGASPSIQALA